MRNFTPFNKANFRSFMYWSSLAPFSLDRFNIMIISFSRRLLRFDLLTVFFIQPEQDNQHDGYQVIHSHNFSISTASI